MTKVQCPVCKKPRWRRLNTYRSVGPCKGCMRKIESRRRGLR